MSITMEQLVQEYLDRRNQLDALEREYKDRKAPVKNEMDKIEAAMQRIMNDQGTTSVKTSAGTAYQQQWTTAKVTEWEDVLSYVREHDRFDLLERRVNKTAVLDTEEPIPGVEVQQGYKVNVRRS